MGRPPVSDGSHLPPLPRDEVERLRAIVADWGSALVASGRLTHNDLRAALWGGAPVVGPVRPDPLLRSSPPMAGRPGRPSGRRIGRRAALLAARPATGFRSGFRSGRPAHRQVRS